MRALYRKANSARCAANRSVSWIPGNLEDTGSLERLLKGAEGVIHCAGVVRGNEWYQFKQVNTDGVARMVQAAKRMHPSPRFLLLSSLAAREPQLSYYAASKRQGEGILETRGGSLEWAILRPPAVYGPGDREIAPLLRLMCHGLAPQATPDKSKFSMIYIDDLAEAIMALMSRDGWKRWVFELHDGRPDGYAWREVVQTVSGVVSRPIWCFRVPHRLLRAIAVLNLWAARKIGFASMLSPGKMRELTHMDWTCDNERITTETGWRPHITLEEGIQKTLVFLGCLPEKPTGHTKGTQHADL